MFMTNSHPFSLSFHLDKKAVRLEMNPWIIGSPDLQYKVLSNRLCARKLS